MRISGIFSPTPNSSIVNKKHQMLTNQKNSIFSTNNNLRKDTITISSQGKSNNLINSLMKEKIAITDRKNEFFTSAVERGESMEYMRSQLDAYDEQIKNIDKQIAEITAKQMQQEVEKNKPKLDNDKAPKTKEEIQNQKLSTITSLSVGLENVEAVKSIKTKFDGEIGVLKSEIELDKIRSNGSEASMNMIAKKEDKLAEMEESTANLTSEIGQQLVEITEEVNESNKDIAETKKVEENKNTDKSEEDREKDLQE